MNAAIFILSQNTDVRRTYLKTCLYFLFKNFNAEHKYPVIIFHEGDFDDKSQTEILMSIRQSCRSCVTFRALDADDFVLPAHIDKAKMDKCIATKPTPYWRNAKYRMMCRWWLVHMPKYAEGYDYVMRVDDDSFIEEPVPDLFKWTAEKKLVYASNLLHLDCGICCYGMKEFFDKLHPEKKKELSQMFMEQEVPSRAVSIHPFRTLLSITQDTEKLPEIGEKIKISMPIMYYNNFFITRTDFWKRKEVKKDIEAIDKNGSIFYFRWGDAPLQSILVMLHSKEGEVSRSIFKYSKRLQRESFWGDDNQYHCYFPLTYDKTSCITEENLEKLSIN
jgi:alpha 1,2-mannosyltransferase